MTINIRWAQLPDFRPHTRDTFESSGSRANVSHMQISGGGCRRRRRRNVVHFVDLARRVCPRYIGTTFGLSSKCREGRNRGAKLLGRVQSVKALQTLYGIMGGGWEGGWVGCMRLSCDTPLIFACADWLCGGSDTETKGQLPHCMSPHISRPRFICRVDSMGGPSGSPESLRVRSHTQSR